METISNKQRVLLFYKLIVGQRKAELIPEFVREDYLQHNPMVKQGRAGITEMINYLKTLPPPPEGAVSPIIRAIQEGDLVVTHLDIQFMGKRMAVIDIFKLKDGMLAEHWDVIQELPDQTGYAVTATNGTSAVNTTASAHQSKAVVMQFYDAVIGGASPAQFIKSGYAEHDAAVITSNAGLYNYLINDIDRDIKIHQMIAEGDFVMVQSEFKRNGSLFSFFELFRIEDDQIAEHWSVEQLIG